jgi:hypothetical protein
MQHPPDWIGLLSGKLSHTARQLLQQRGLFHISSASPILRAQLQHVSLYWERDERRTGASREAAGQEEQ